MISKLNYLKSIGCIVKKEQIIPGKYGDVIRTPDGSYVAHADIDDGIINIIYKNKLTDLQAITPGKAVCIGFCPSENGWAGWSHRAYYIFKIGHTTKQGDCCCSDGEIQPGFVCETLDDCKKCAIAFAKSIA